MTKKTIIILLLIIPALWGCSTVGPVHENLPPVGGCEYLDQGLASWYGNEFKGRRTASGEKFIPSGLTAAHRTLPFGSLVRVTLDRPKTEENSVVVRINDRGPFVKGRIIDLSRGASKQLHMDDTQRVHIYLCQ